jgi:hypothetical protein
MNNFGFSAIVIVFSILLLFFIARRRRKPPKFPRHPLPAFEPLNRFLLIKRFHEDPWHF